MAKVLSQLYRLFLYRHWDFKKALILAIPCFGEMNIYLVYLRKNMV